VESNWRWNIPNLGMSHGDWQLCARFVESPPFTAWMVKRGNSNVPEVWETSGPDQLPVYAFSFPEEPADVHFPWGYDVEPD